MADTLIGGVTLVEKESRSIGDVPVGGIIEWDETFSAVPENFRECNGGTVNDPSSPYIGTAVPDLNTNYWSCSGVNFKTIDPSVDNTSFNITTGAFTADQDDREFMASVNLPNGAVVTSVEVHGNAGAASGINWNLIKADQAGGAVNMAFASVNTADTSIDNATINNSTNSYFLNCDVNLFDTGDVIYGATIAYTPRFKFIIRIK